MLVQLLSDTSKPRTTSLHSDMSGCLHRHNRHDIRGSSPTPIYVCEKSNCQRHCRASMPNVGQVSKPQGVSPADELKNHLKKENKKEVMPQ